ncbi:beta-galactosidase trimerization domain-containing protein [bacterium]|nr:beta-galactosidase trimerization domain-containing protein [bacterium]
MIGRLTRMSFTVLAAVAWSQTAPAVELLGKDRMFIRFTNVRPDQGRILIRLNIVPNHHQPFSWTGKTVYVGGDGAADAPGTPDRYLGPTDSSPWVDVGQYMNKQGTRSWATYLSPLLCGVLTEPAADGLFLVAEIAQGPGTKVIRRVEVKMPDLPAKPKERKFPWLLGYSVWNGYQPFLPTLGLLVPTQPDVGPRIYTLEEALRAQLDAIEEFPDRGRLPTQIVFKTSDHPEVKQALGYNGYPADIVEGNLGDEIGLSLKIPVEEQDRRFREYLNGKGIDPRQLMADENAAKARGLTRDQQWSLVTLLPPLPDKPVQFYESANFRYQLWYEELAAQTKEIEAKNPDKQVLCGANFSPHMNVWPDVRQWVDPFKAGALTMSWTEDWWWQLPEVSPQVYGFLLDGLRLAGTYHGATMQYYVMPFKGQSADNLRRMHSLAFAHGAKIINHFVTQNQSMITWDYVDQIESPRTYQAIDDMIRDAGAVEHRLFPALPRPAQVAIMLSRAADTWDTEDLGGAGHLYGAKYNVNNDERKALWMALRHAQYPVDLITDEDVADGRLGDYRVLYVVGSEMLAAAVKPLTQWVRNGGMLYATGGGGLLDEYHQEQRALLNPYGLQSHALVRAVRGIRPRRDLPALTPLDTVVVTGSAPFEFPALCYQDDLKPARGTKVLATYQKDGAPALTLHPFGKGAVYYSGALAGLAYLTPAMPPSSAVLPTKFPAELRSLILTPVTAAKIVPPVTTSDELVEAQYLEGPNGAIVTLTNWREVPIEQLVVRFPGQAVKTVRSLRAAGYFQGHLHEQQRGALPVQVVDGVPQVELTLAVTDYLLVD